ESQGRGSVLPEVVVGLGHEGGGGGEGDRSGWREVWALQGEMHLLRRQLLLSERRCHALKEMQILADQSFAQEHASQVLENLRGHGAGQGPRVGPGEGSEGSGEEGGQVSERERGRGGGYERLLACWRGEVLKLLVQREADKETAASEVLGAQRAAEVEGEARGRAEALAEGLEQRALAAEAEAELVQAKLEDALRGLADQSEGRRVAEAAASSRGVTAATLASYLKNIATSMENLFYEKEASLAKVLSTIEEFSCRLRQEVERLQLLSTLLDRKEVQLRNSRAALAADQRTWLKERRNQELSALARAAPGARDTGAVGPGGGPGGPEGTPGGSGVVGRDRDRGLEGLRPECEAVMRAVFCRLDRSGRGAVSGKRLLRALRSDRGVTKLMEASVGPAPWASTLGIIEASLLPHPSPGPATDDDNGREPGGRGGRGGGGGSFGR
ncbi:unnamed protein product, partial [Discosporangium mesarthrocarpum]